MLIPSTRHARRTRAYISTRYIPPPSSQSNPDRRLYAVPFWSATAGSTGRFSGGLLRRRSQSGVNRRHLVEPGLRFFELCREAEQQTVIGMLGEELHTAGQPVRGPMERQGDAR